MVFSPKTLGTATLLLATGGVLLPTAAVPVSGAAPLARRQSTSAITALSTTQITAFRPYTHYASTGYCEASLTAQWTCGTNCDANPTFVPTASGGDGDDVQYCAFLSCPTDVCWMITHRVCCVRCGFVMTGFVGYDPTLQTVVVVHQGTNYEEM